MSDPSSRPWRWHSGVPAHLMHQEARPEGVALALQWVGTAGFRVVTEGHHFWLDPHLSRHSLGQLLRGPIAPDGDRIDAEVDICHAVAVGHSHFDHAMDTPYIARKHGARVYGAEDTLNCCRGAGVPEAQLVTMAAGGSYAEGPWRLRALRSQHSPLLLGRVPLPGRIERPLSTPARYSAWRVGETFGLHLSCAAGSVYHIGSANLIEAELQGVQSDVVLCCTVGRQAVQRFTWRMIEALRPKVVIPCHWERFWRSMDAPPLQIPGNDLHGFMDECASHPLAPEVRLLPMRGWSTLA